MRFIVSLLLLGIVFFIGFSFGTTDDHLFKSSQKHNEMKNTQDIIYQTNHINNRHETEDNDNPNIVETVNDKQPQSLQATQKIARFLEVVINGFYELVVGVLYEISALFF